MNRKETLACKPDEQWEGGRGGGERVKGLHCKSFSAEKVRHQREATLGVFMDVGCCCSGGDRDISSGTG